MTCRSLAFGLRAFVLLLPLAMMAPPSSAGSLEDGEAHLAANHFEKAAADFRDASKKGSDEERARALRAQSVAHFARYEHADAMGSLVDAIAMDPGYVGNPGLVIRLISELSISGPPPRWTESVERLETASREYPHLANRIVELVALNHEYRHEITKAHEIGDRLHHIEDFYVIGPFANPSGGGIDESYPPEEGVDFDADYRDPRGRTIRWIRKEPGAYPIVNFDTILDSPPDAVAYALTHVNSEESRSAVMRLNGSGAFRLWVNDELVLDENEFRAGFDLYEVPVSLRRGWNRVLVKGAAGMGGLFFRLNVEDEDGHPLSLEADASASYVASNADADRTRVEIPTGIDRAPEGGWLRRWRQTMDGANLADRLIFTSHMGGRGFLELTDELIDDTAARYPESALVEELRAQVLDIKGSGEAEAMNWNLVEAAPELFSAQLYVLSHYLERNEVTEASKALDAAMEHFDNNPILSYFHGVLRLTKGEFREGVDEMEKAVAESPGNSILAGLHLQMLQATDDPAAYERALRRLSEHRPDDPNTARLLANHAFQRDAFDEAITEFRRALEYGAAANIVYLEMATVYVEAGEREKAIAVLHEGLRYCPMSVGMTDMLGQLYLLLGQKKEAREQLVRNLELNPTAFTIRDILREIDGLPPLRGFFEPMTLSEVIARDVDEFSGDANAVRLYDAAHLIQYRNGSYERVDHEVTRILTQSGVEAIRTVMVPWDSQGNSGVEIARVMKPDGREIAADVRGDQASFGELDVGDVIELRTVVRSGPQYGLSGHFWHSVSLQQEIPCVVARFSVLTPADLEYRVEPHRFDGDSDSKRHDEWIQRTWEARDLAAAVQEGNMPPRSERLVWLDLSSLSSWDDVVRWYNGVSQGRTRTTPELRNLAAELSRNATTDTERIAAVADYVRENIKYEGGFFTESAFVPHPADRVLRQRFGDCKDQTALILSLLRAMDIEARFALVNSRDVSTVRFLPSPRFSHAIAQVRTAEGEVFWIDPTAKGLGFPNVPVPLEKALALVIDPDNPVFVEIEVDEVGTNGTESTMVAKVDRTGNMSVSGTVRFEGEDASNLRQLLRNFPQRRAETVERALVEALPGVRLESHRFEAIEEVDQPLRLTYEATCPDAATFAGDLLILSVPWAFSRAPEHMVPTETRHNPLILNSWRGEYTETVELHLPDGFEPMASPEAVHLKNDAGIFDLDLSEIEDGKLTVDRRLEIRKLRIETKEYAEFRMFLNQAHKAEQQQLVLRKAG